MKIAKLLALFAILPIVCLLGQEEVKAVSPSDKLKKDDLDVDDRIRRLLQKRKLIMLSVIAATVLAAGGILGGVGYGIVKHRKKARMEMDEPFTDLGEPIQIKKETNPFKMTSETLKPEVIVTTQRATGQMSRPSVIGEDVDGDTGENLGDSFFDKSFKPNVMGSPII
ncbi:early transcribed membrane protein (etramp) [Plasmodium vivax India VII]|uniref:Early transcribed membrane protein (ETRAMP) n=4 Tax=Plasmodium vivax TaxID=5855 RepID=A5KCB1_PLAVS|nr:early transcribed membrane protein (ETRAMP) [Plasmodium vivax]EDL42975.1 early transcribed membrane protein (ETRAMP) [Plasmodium vivax]KMZ81660.1 early transcribed membrane protein (etramp) [Plasmodium vivax India VII]KMZ87761.1 early transcribed membrane protein (etramp) [Plasmodium vivax Brazil I]KMZ94286.1 early transcribed membrane protein (etramp) [Plasmodium vivax Mauritania I]|eukprot:XP_001612702.1 early transcribed membrane protein (ETRAMP) [Plasmodium vivax Sal-1]